MGKITFRADDDLVDELESFDVSKSEVMREALRSYLGRSAPGPATRTASSPAPEDAASGAGRSSASLDEALDDRIDDVLADRLGESDSTDVNLRITVDSEHDSGSARSVAGAVADGESRPTPDSMTAFENADLDATGSRPRTCSQCGMDVQTAHVYCPNCGEKTTGRVFCECGDEVRSDWAFCPSCGRRTPAADVLDSA